MKAVTRMQYGGPECLTVQDIDTPKPGPKEALIKVHYATVNRTDCGALWGKPWIYRLFVGYPKPKKISPGTDLSGEVVEVGPEFKGLRVGDRIIAFNDNGELASQAEYTMLKPGIAFAKIPEEVPSDLAAASVEGGHYAYNFINKVQMKEGQKVFLHGATGGIGSAGLQFLKHMGLHVTATSTTKNVQKIKALGADRVIDWETEDYLKDDGERYDFFFDSVGKSAFGWCKHLLTPTGVYISSELGPRGENPFRAMLGAFQRGKKVKFPMPADVQRSLDFILARLTDGSYQPVIDRVVSMDEIKETYEYVCAGKKTGNVLLRLAPE